MPDNAFAGLTALTSLDFNFNSLTTLGEDAFDGLTALTSLDLSDNSLTALDEDIFDGLTALTSLDLNFNRSLAALDKDIFAGLTALEHLNLAFTNQTALDADIFAGLTALDTLGLGQNGLTTLDADLFDDLTALRVLGLAGNSLTTLDADIFDGPTTLEELDLPSNLFTTLDADLFDGLTALKKLYLNSNLLTTLDADLFDGLTTLEELNLSSNPLTTLDADLFDGLTALKELKLYQNSLSTLDADLFDGLTALTRLELQDNSLTALDADIFDGITALDRLELKCNYFTALDLDIFDPFAATLTYLDLTSDSFTTPPVESAIRTKFSMITDVLIGVTPCLRVTVSPTSLTVTEGATGTLAVALRAQPTANVMVAISSDNSDVTLAPAGPLTFTASDWDTPQMVTVSAAQDSDDADESATLILDPSGSNYDFVSSSALTVVVTDDDEAQTGICSRTAEVQTALLAATSRTACADVTTADLAAVTSLTVSNYSGTSLDPADFAGLTGLTSLEIDDSPQLTTVPDNAFAGLTALTTLDFSFLSSLTTLAEDAFDGLTALETLNLEYTDLTALDADLFDGLTALETLYLNNNSLTTLDADLFDGLTVLETLYLTSNLLTTLNADIFDSLTALETLGLGHNGLTTLDADIFDDLTALRILGLSVNGLTTLDADIFDDLTAMETLALDNNGLTTLDADLFDGLTALETLYLNNNLLTTLDADLFDGLTTLEELYLSSNILTTMDADLFDGLTALTKLYLNSNLLTTMDADLFDGLTALSDLRLDQNSLGTMDADIFDGLTALTILALQDNRLTALDADIFDGISLLDRLDLNCNYFTALDLNIFNPFAATLTALNLQSDSFTTPPTDAAIRAKFTNIDTVLTGVTTCDRVTVSPTSLTVTEGATGTLSVALRSLPTDDVTLAISSDNPDVTVTPAGPLTFTVANWDTAQTVTVSAAQDPDQADESATLILDPGGDGNVYPFVFSTALTVTVTDDDGTAVNNAPTVATEIPNQTAMSGTALDYTFPADTFTDADGDTLTYTATLADDSALPTWLSFSAATRAFSGTPQAADVETVSVKVTASDGNGGSVSDTFDIVVSVAMDTTAPRVASIVRQNPTSSPTNADSLTWRVTFSEAVSNVNAADFAVSGTTATVTAVAVSGLTGAYDVSASGGNLAALNATVTLAIAASHNIEDGASNALTNTTPTGTNNNSYVVDNTAPSVTISGVPASSDAPFRATFTFSEAVTGFAVGDIRLDSASGSSFTVTSTTVYRALVTPTAAGTVTVDVPANAARDAAGNGNTAATQASSTYSGTVIPAAMLPTVTLRTQSVPESIGTAMLVVTLDQPASAPLSVPWYTLSSTAASPGDYTNGAGTLIIPSGVTNATISITIIDDAVEEPTETVLVLLSPGDGL